MVSFGRDSGSERSACWQHSAGRGNGAKVDLARDAGAGDYAIDVGPHIRETQSGARCAVGDHHAVVVFSGLELHSRSGRANIDVNGLPTGRVNRLLVGSLQGRNRKEISSRGQSSAEYGRDDPNCTDRITSVHNDV